MEVISHLLHSFSLSIPLVTFFFAEEISTSISSVVIGGGCFRQRGFCVPTSLQGEGK